MRYVLLDQPNPNGDHFYPTRRRRVKAGVVHITAGLEDLDGVDDHSAEATAEYAATTAREVSWQSGSDTDSFVRLLPPSYTAWHCQGYNSSTYGHEISKRTVDWTAAPPAWVDATLRRAAAGLRPIAAELAIPPRRATRAELDRAIATDGPPVGWIAHAELDPARRTDPGRTFPWARFLALMADPEEDNEMAADPQVLAGLDRIADGIEGLYRSGFASRTADGKPDPTHDSVSVAGVNRELDRIAAGQTETNRLLGELVDRMPPRPPAA